MLRLDRFPNSGGRQKAVSLFQREAAVLSRLQHPGIPRVEPDGYFTLSVANGELWHCLVMEKIEGLNLQQWQAQRNQQPLSQEQAIAWLSQLAEILGQVHQQELVHRDIKPSNIMLRPNGQLVLIDFGAVREVTETYLQRQERNATGTVIISAGYTPPEQAEGQAVAQSDFFALGRTFVYLLTGKRPTDFDKDPRTGRLLWRERALQVSKELADLIDYLMAAFPGRRPQTPEVILRCLAELRDPAPPLPPVPLTQQRTRSPDPVTSSSNLTGTPKRKPFLALISGLLPTQAPRLALGKRQNCDVPSPDIPMWCERLPLAQTLKSLRVVAMTEPSNSGPCKRANSSTLSLGILTASPASRLVPIVNSSPVAVTIERSNCGRWRRENCYGPWTGTQTASGTWPLVPTVKPSSVAA